MSSQLSHARLFERYSRVLAKFPRQPHWQERYDLHDTLSKTVHEVFEGAAAEHLQMKHMHKCIQTITALESLASNEHSDKYRVSAMDRGTLGYTQSELQQVIKESLPSISRFNRAPGKEQGLLTRLFARKKVDYDLEEKTRIQQIVHEFTVEKI